MYYAKSMYQGGMIVCADDADYSSYLLLGLRCLECGEEVNLKSGCKRKPHFAHFKATLNSQCSLRVTGYGQDCWSYLTPEGRKQRREFFQKYFLDMIARHHNKFYETLQLFQTKLSSWENLGFIEECCYWFYKNAHLLIKQCRMLPKTSYDNRLLLQRLITCEAIDYLSVPSSRSLLELLVHYSLYNGVEQKPFEIGRSIKDMLLDIPWLSIFSFQWKKHTNLQLGQSKTIIERTNELRRAIQKYIYTDNKLSEPFLLGNLSVKLHLNGLFIHLLDNRAARYTILKTIAHITNYNADNSKQKIIINWKFLDEIFMSESNQYIKYCQLLESQINNFLRMKIKNNFEVEFKFIESDYLIKVKEREKAQIKVRNEREKAQIKARVDYIMRTKEKQIEHQIKVREEEKKKIQEELRKKVAEKYKKKAEKHQRKRKVKEKLKKELEKELMKFTNFLAEDEVNCPYCQNKVIKNKLKRHLTRVHKDTILRLST